MTPSATAPSAPLATGTPVATSAPLTAGATAPTWAVGDLRVHRIDEAELPGATGQWLLPDATPDVVRGTPWLQPDFATPDGVLRLSSHSFAVETNGLRVLIDTGIGNGKIRANPAWHDLNTPYLDRLTAAGFPPESVDLVVLTHLHADHVGWNTREDGGDWVPTFPRARYLTSRTEWEFWTTRELEPPRAQMFRDSVHPIHDAGLLDLVDVADSAGRGAGGIEVAPGIRLLPAPGHTPGQVAVELRGADTTALITGDSIHHPVQLAHPHLTSCVDIDPAEAVRTRNRLLATHSEALLLGSHFPHPTTVALEG
ncbi:MBL fold metallo-hydrolase [Streptomyces iconiensis]|uniref:MBL fold metallo-hydrolase n=1 Tax=Streptomyces iconiensis TaxID=1384038 RepID=A0ABT7A6S4_9ACTN|nr:MBL fold metallo-hydrolase [Streptomyces iconiensis]MDJ1137040.1 MBL fold metallo-hydrolase [Streptomyces iconiensis]